MQEAADILKTLASFPVTQLLLVGGILLLGWWLWLKANKVASAEVDEGSKPATLLALSTLRAEMQSSQSERDSKIYERVNNLDQRLSFVEGQLEGGGDLPPRRRRRAEQ